MNTAPPTIDLRRQRAPQALWMAFGALLTCTIVAPGAISLSSNHSNAPWAMVGLLTVALLAVADSILRSRWSQSHDPSPSTGLLKAALETAADGIIVVDERGKLLCFNQAAEEMLGRGPASLEPQRWASHYRLRLATGIPLPGEAFPLCRALGGESLAASDFLVERGGRDHLVVSATAQPLLEGGRQLGAVCVLRDVTEMRAIEARSQELNERLRQSSRRAGMAEVAAEVLHNIGNVMNSIHVSSCMLQRSLQGVRTDGVQEVARLLEAHSDRLQEFTETDPRGQRLAAFLRRCSAKLDDQHESMRSEVACLNKNLTHVEQIIGRQKNYAKQQYRLELIDADSLVDDALDAVAASLRREEVDWERSVPVATMVRTDRHQIIEVLVNLLTNARNALADTADRRLYIDIHVLRAGAPLSEDILGFDDASTEQDVLEIAITDNGCGIAAEQLPRIFQHGYTTSSAGSGIGLHFAANAVRQLGGELTADSQGEGLGATFTVRLPALANERLSVP